MAYCIHCGAVLRQEVNFCEKCGARVVGEFSDRCEDCGDEFDDDDVPEVDDCDEDPEKGPPSDCYATFNGREVTVYRESGAIYRRFTLRYEVLNVQVCGDKVSVTCAGGWYYIYTLDGMLVRQMRH